MTTEPVSCIVPAYNSQRFIREALESIFAQSRPPAEVIVVDDGSTDGTSDIVKRFRPRVRYLFQNTAGPSATRNAGIIAAGQAFVAFLDADDLWHREKIAWQLDCFRRNPALDVCVTFAQNVWTSELADEADRLQNHPRNQSVPAYISGAMLARKAVFDRVGLFNEKLWFADAAEWFMRARGLGISVQILPEVLMYHRMHGQNISRRFSERSKLEFIRVVRESIFRRRGYHSDTD